MDPEFSLWAIVHVVCLALRTIYEFLKDKGRVDPNNKLFFGAIAGVMIGLWVSWFSLCPLDPLRTALSVALHYAGLVILVAGLILAIGALVQLRGVENIQHLVTSGLFARLRHPMYVGFVAWIIGWSVFHGAAVSFLLGMLTTANILYWRHLEERHLADQFGAGYVSYKQHTWF